MRLEQAQELAEAAKAELAPYCKPGYCRIAGSIRRKKPEVGDIELVVIPEPSELMGFYQAVNKWPKIKGEAKGKYTQRIYGRMKLDLFIATPQTFGCNYVIRTGSAEFSHGLAIRARQVGLCFKDAQLRKLVGALPGEILAGINDEIDVFEALKIKWVEPEKRQGSLDVVPED